MMLATPSGPHLPVASHINFLGQAIASQRAALRFHLVLASGVIILGLATILIAQKQASSLVPENFKWLLQLGGGFVSTLSTFPLKEIFSRRDRIAALSFLEQEFTRLTAAPVPDNQQMERLEQRFWQFIDKGLGG